MENFHQDEELDNALQKASDSRESWNDFWANLKFHYLYNPKTNEFTYVDLPLHFEARELCSEMAELSIALHAWNPFFFPMLMPDRHDIFTQILDELGVQTPELPKATNHAGCVTYYYDVCQCIADFARENELSQAEMIEYIYGFGYEMYKSDHQEGDEIENLPKPTRIWLAGASKEDVKNLEANPDLNQSIWQCNESVNPGDIVVVYARTPHSCIHSIWRSCTGGFFNPFDGYHNRTTLCQRVDTPRISHKAIKANEAWADAPIVRKNFQGLHLFEVTPLQYRALFEMFEQEGDDTSKYPSIIMNEIKWNDDEIKIEKDVEEKILIPFLEELGYEPNDWERQLKQKSGRKEFEIPDFVFFSSGEHLANNAPFVIEAKYDMKNRRETEDAFKQARSYARMLDASLFAICDKNRIMVYQANKNGQFDFAKPVINEGWASLDEEASGKLRSIIGKEAVLKLCRKRR